MDFKWKKKSTKTKLNESYTLTNVNKYNFVKRFILFFRRCENVVAETTALKPAWQRVFQGHKPPSFWFLLQGSNQQAFDYKLLALSTMPQHSMKVKRNNTEQCHFFCAEHFHVIFIYISVQLIKHSTLKTVSKVGNQRWIFYNFTSLHEICNAFL